MQIDLEGKALSLRLGTLTLTCRPCCTALMYAAVAAARDRLQAELAAGQLPDEPAEREGRFRALQAAELARRAVTGWEGAKDRQGKPLAFSPETVALAMERHFALADRFLELYAEREDRWMAEGNVSGPSPSGTGEGVPSTVVPAENSEAAALEAHPARPQKKTRKEKAASALTDKSGP